MVLLYTLPCMFGNRVRPPSVEEERTFIFSNFPFTLSNRAHYRHASHRLVGKSISFILNSGVVRNYSGILSRHTGDGTARVFLRGSFCTSPIRLSMIGHSGSAPPRISYRKSIQSGSTKPCKTNVDNRACTELQRGRFRPFLANSVPLRHHLHTIG